MSVLNAKKLSLCLALAYIALLPSILCAHAKELQYARKCSVFAVGDIMLAGKAKPFLKEKGYDYPFENKDLSQLISSAGVRFANLEYPITIKGEHYKDKQFIFKGDPQSITSIKKAGFDLVSLANNHIMDYGEAGLKDTIKLCKKNNLVFTGAGSDMISASRLAIFKRHGVRYGLLAYSQTFPEEFWATMKKPGTSHPDWEQVSQDIRESRPKVNILIVSFHWGEELKEEPKKYQIDFAHHAINSGADMILGHHPHIPQAIEIFKGRPIFYSLGNYAFGAISKNAKTSFAAETIFKNNCPAQVLLYPLNVNNDEVYYQPKLAKGASAKKIISRLREISKTFDTTIEYKNDIGKISIAPHHLSCENSLNSR